MTLFFKKKWTPKESNLGYILSIEVGKANQVSLYLYYEQEQSIEER